MKVIRIIYNWDFMNVSIILRRKTNVRYRPEDKEAF